MTDAPILAALQRGIPLARRPFAELADTLNVTETALLGFIRSRRRDGVVRRFGAVFDTRRLGYRSVLCAATVPTERIDEAAASLTPLVGVTHCYERTRFGAPPADSAAAPLPNLWFTLSYPEETFDGMARSARSRLAPWPVDFLPATRRYKVDVVFGAATRARDEAVADAALPPLTEEDRALIGALQGDTEVCSDYFAAIADRVGMKEWDVLSRLEIWRRCGRLKRIGLLLAHRAAGWRANGMCCWSVAGDTTAPGRALAADARVTHCYERTVFPRFPYNLFAMIHAQRPEEAAAQFDGLQRQTGLSDGIMLLSTHEYKKTSMTFFAPEVVSCFQI